MNKEIFILLEVVGDWEDRKENIVAAYLDEALAESCKIKAQEESNRLVVFAIEEKEKVALAFESTDNDEDYNKLDNEYREKIEQFRLENLTIHKECSSDEYEHGQYVIKKTHLVE